MATQDDPVPNSSSSTSMSYDVVIDRVWSLDKGDLPPAPAQVTPDRSNNNNNKEEEGEELAAIPPNAIDILDKIHEEPLPRTKALAAILCKLIPLHSMTDSSVLTAVSCQRLSSLRKHLGPNTASSLVAISSVPEVWSDPSSLGMGGVGKSTMAALVASHIDVRKWFSDGIAWVDVGAQEMNYERYCTLLREICLQIVPHEAMPVFPVLVRIPCEASSTRERREQGFMMYARDAVSDLMEARQVLIILDNVEYKSDLDWFRFSRVPGSNSSVDSMGDSHASISECPTVLVVTRHRDLVSSQDTVEIDLLYEAEAIRLMVTESGQTLDRASSETREARLMVQVCADHPLAVKSVGRWLSLKHAKSGATGSVQDSLEEVGRSIDNMLAQSPAVDQNCDTMYEILSMAFSPAVNGKPTVVIKFCFAAFVTVFCQEEHHSLFSPIEKQPIIPMALAEMLFKALLNLEEERLLEEGSLFYTQLRDATMLIPEALSALGVIKVLHRDEESTEKAIDHDEDDTTTSEMTSQDDSLASVEAPAFLQIMHRFFQEYGEYLANEDAELRELTKNGELKWNREFVSAYLASCNGWQVQDPSMDYAVEMIVSHMLRAEMYEEAYQLMTDKEFVQVRVESMGRENATRQHITDCEALHKILTEEKGGGRGEKFPRVFMERAYNILGDLLSIEQFDDDVEEELNPFVETGLAHYEIGLSLAEKRYWHAAITHWETSQEILVASLGVEEFVAAVLFNTGVAYAELYKYKKALSFLKRCLQIRGAIHGERHTLFAQTVQKLGDVLLSMNDFSDAMDCYSLALDIMHLSPNYHRVDIGDILENMGRIHYGKGEAPEALKCYQDALRSKRVELGHDHPELAATYQHIGDCLSDDNKTEEAIANFEEAIRLRKLDPIGGDEQDAEILSIEGVLSNLHGKTEEGLQCYEKSLEILATKVPHKKEKIAALLHLIGCVYLMMGDHEKAMEMFEESLQARQRIFGFIHLEVASTLFNIAFLHQLCNRLGMALQLLQEALKIRLRILPDSEKIALTHEKIGILSNALGNKEQAKSSFDEVLRIRKLIHGDEHESVASILHELGDLADEMGEYEEAIKYFTEALDIRRKCLGPDHEEVAATLYCIGFTLHHQDRSVRALQYFEEALDIRKILFGEDSKKVADVLNMMGFLNAKCGETEEALSLLWEALRILKLHGDVVNVAEILKGIGNVHREKKEFELAAECYGECLRIRREEFGDDHEKVADAFIAIGNIRSETEERLEAMAAYEEALRIRTLVHGRTDERVAQVLQSMGTVEFQSRNFENAQRHLDEFVRIRRENQEEYDSEFVNVIFMLGNIHKAEGRNREANQCWSEAHQLFQELNLAEENPELGMELKRLLVGDPSHHETADANDGDWI